MVLLAIVFKTLGLVLLSDAPYELFFFIIAGKRLTPSVFIFVIVSRRSLSVDGVTMDMTNVFFLFKLLLVLGRSRFSPSLL